MLFLISYDLNDPGQNYPRVHAALQAFGAKPVLYSQWQWTGTLSCQDIYNAIVGAFDQNDRGCRHSNFGMVGAETT